MEKLEQYRNAVRRTMLKVREIGSSSVSINRQVIFDAEHDHYQLVNVGWMNDRRIYGCVLHIDIQDDKIWIQHNGTELNIADEFVALGIPKEDIVLGFQLPFKRQFSEFAVN